MTSLPRRVRAIATAGQRHGMPRRPVRLLKAVSRRQVLVPDADHSITVAPASALVSVVLDGREIASSSETLVLRETGYPPVHYFPTEHIDPDVLVASDHTTYCPFKGDASYFDLRVGERTVAKAVWTYRSPHEAVAQIAGRLAFYAKRVDRIDVVDVS